MEAPLGCFLCTAINHIQIMCALMGRAAIHKPTW